MAPSPSQDVAAWIELARHGATDAVDRLCRSYGPGLEAYAKRHMGPGVRRWIEPSDIVQHVLVEVLQGLPRLPRSIELDPDGLLARLRHRTIARIRDTVRRHARSAGESVLPEARLDPAAATPSAGDVTTNDTRDWVEALVARLPEKYALPVLLIGIDGLTYAEAAEELGLEAETVRKRYERARDRLKVRLAGRIGGRHG